ncbi:MAG: aminotransferase class IV [Patescibacteria group bacterium]|nr:aminotransferase class IV [Patescibacteria group bacterium]MDD4610419.1 aminotransferase class IV [Patescibacteria group bacterium]
MKYAVYNGKIIDKKNANVSVMDKAYFFDFCVYSSIKVIQGKIFFPEYHVDRLFESAKIINLGHKFKKEEVLDWLDLCVKKNKLKDALLKIILIGDAEKNQEAKLFIFPVAGLTFYSKQIYRDGIKVITYQGKRRIPNSKTKDLLLSFLAYRQARESGAMEALMIDNNGNIREGTQTNFFAVKGNTLIMPPKGKVLAGITKKLIIESVKGQFKIKEENIAFKNIKQYDEFFISSTTRNVMPIKQIDKIDVSSDFQKIKIIQKLFKEYYQKLGF